MALQRPPEPFHRVYSPPEPPPTARRPAFFGFVTVAVAAVIAVAAGFVLGFGGGPDATGPADRASVGGGSAPDSGAGGPAGMAGPSGSASPGSARSGSARSGSASPDANANARIFRSVPASCTGVAVRTLDRLVGRRTISKSANTSLATCTFTATSGDFRWLRVETRVIPPAVSGTPVQDAGAFFGAQWDRAHQDVVSRTISLKRYEGLGDEAYRWFKRDNGQPTVVGETAVRFRNAVITVSYSRRAPGKDGFAQSERDCLSDATAVARDVLATFH